MAIAVLLGGIYDARRVEMNRMFVRNTKRCALVCLCLGWFATMAPADTYPRQHGVDALNYVFRITLSDDTDEIAGEATIDLRFVKDSLDGIHARSGFGERQQGDDGVGSAIGWRCPSVHPQS